MFPPCPAFFSCLSRQGQGVAQQQGMSTKAVERFWQWCATRGIISKQLSLRSVGSVAHRGLFLEEAVKAGSVLMTIPYKACVNRELMSTSAAVPPVQFIAKTLSRCHLEPQAAEFLWLSAYLALLPMESTAAEAVEDYVGIFPSPASVELNRRAARAALPPAERREFEEIALSVAASTRAVSRLIRKYDALKRRRMPRAAHCDRRILATLSDAQDIARAHDTVVSRAVDIPWGCKKSIPDDLTTFLESNDSVATLPTLVPVVDLINSAPPVVRGSAEVHGNNCELFTCVASEFQHENTRRKKRCVGSAANRLDRMRIAVCATKPIAVGEELLMDYNLDDRPATAFRFGFVPREE